ncbi:MAG: D-alanyl-D-alanine carboxypeptidase [Bdellovibrio sp.]|nr:D-alanyl-D-alanine carboxypeptidase [Bdellovibrio sp.]
MDVSHLQNFLRNALVAVLYPLTLGLAYASPPLLVPAIPPSLERVIANSKMTGPSERHTSLGMALVDIQTNQLREEYNANASLPWASVSKMLTLYYALSILGPQNTFQTELLTNGKISNSEVRGDLILKGGGDPSLNTDGLINLALALKSQGITKITGRLFYDENHFYNQSKIANFGVGDEAYNQSIGALNLYFNRIQIVRSSGNGFRPVPELPHFHLAADDQADFVQGQRFKFLDNGQCMEDWRYSNNKRYEALEELPIKHPSRFTAEIFADLLRAIQIEIGPPELLPMEKQNELYKNAQSIAIHHSPPIFDLARSAMEYSNNLYTEAMLIKAARQSSSKNVTLKEAADTMLVWYKANAPKIPWGDISMINGSGLTAENRFAANTLASWISSTHLTKFSSETTSPQYYWALLPMAGQNSWLKERWNQPNIAHRLWAKTGTLDFVQSMAGIFVARSGKLYAFALTAANLLEREKLDKGEQMPQARAGQFGSKAKSLFMDIIKDWYERF